MDGLTLHRMGGDGAYADGLPAVNGDRATPLYDTPLPLTTIEGPEPVLIAPAPTSTPGGGTKGLVANVPPGAVERAPGTVGASDPVLLPAVPTAGPGPQRRGTITQLPDDTVPPAGAAAPVVERVVTATRRMLPTLAAIALVVGGLWLLASDRRK
jgi:hypothetical protein